MGATKQQSDMICYTNMTDADSSNKTGKVQQCISTTQANTTEPTQ
jgi:hypothetical protein